MHSLKSIEKSGGKGQRGSQEEESCRRKGNEEENVRDTPTTSEQGVRGRSHFIGGH